MGFNSEGRVVRIAPLLTRNIIEMKWEQNSRRFGWWRSCDDDDDDDGSLVVVMWWTTSTSQSIKAKGRIEHLQFSRFPQNIILFYITSPPLGMLCFLFKTKKCVCDSNYSLRTISFSTFYWEKVGVEFKLTFPKHPLSSHINHVFCIVTVQLLQEEANYFDVFVFSTFM